MCRFGFIIILLLFQQMEIGTDKNFAFQKEEEFATIVIYAKSGRQFSSFDILLDDVVVISSFPRNTYFVIKQRPGKISLKTKGNIWRNLNEDKDYSLTAVAGATYYLEALIEYQVLMSSMHLIRRSSQVGEKEIKNMKGDLIGLKTP